MSQVVAAGVPSQSEKPAIPVSDQVSPAPTLHGTDERHDHHGSTTEDITYHYISFDTPLPSPNSTCTSTTSTTAAALPPPPDLTRLGNPQLWSVSHKALAVGVASFGCVVVASAAAAYAFAVPQISSSYSVSTNVANIGITVYNIGFAFMPMLCAPLSESVGRYPIFVASGALFLIAQLCTGVSPTLAGIMISRFLAGCGGSTFSTVVGGVVSDLYVAEGRNAPMAVFSGGATIGVGLGLVISGAIVQALMWRWIFYVQTIISAVVVALVVLFLKETRGSVILRRRANALNQWYEKLEEAGYVGVAAMGMEADAVSPAPGAVPSDNPPQEKLTTNKSPEYMRVRWVVEADEKRPAMLRLIGMSVGRPFRMLVTEPVVFFFSLWATFSWSILFLTFESVPLVFATFHGFNNRQNGLVFVSMIVATLIVLPATIVQDKIFRKRHKGEQTSPESRLVFVSVMSACMPAGLFWFGWTQQENVPWIVPVLAVGCLTIGIFTIYLAVLNYFADVYGLYASSAMACAGFCRNVVSSVFPFFANTMFINMGFSRASSLLGGIGVALMVAPFVLMLNGPRIRARSNFTPK